MPRSANRVQVRLSFEPDAGEVWQWLSTLSDVRRRGEMFFLIQYAYETRKAMSGGVAGDGPSLRGIAIPAVAAGGGTPKSPPAQETTATTRAAHGNDVPPVGVAGSAGGELAGWNLEVGGILFPPGDS